MQQVPIVATGLGAVTPFGLGVAAYWQGLVEGKSAVRPAQDPHLARYAPAVAWAPPLSAGPAIPAKLARETGRVAQLALAAVFEALRNAELVDEEGRWRPGVDPDRVGVFFGNSFGDLALMELAARRLALDEDGRAGPRTVARSLPNAAAGSIAMRYGIRGPVLTYATACASSGNAMGEAARWLASGAIDVAVTGGAECLLTPVVLASLREAHALAVSLDGPPSTWSRPFDVSRRGMVPAEGAAAVILEREEDARRRGARARGRLLGYGTASDAYHAMAPDPEGSAAALTIQRALKDAGLSPLQLDYVNAHATSTPAGDLAEERALRRALGEEAWRTVPVSSVKGHMGHVMAASAAVDTIACLLAMETGQLPPNLNLREPDDEAPPCLVRDKAWRKQVKICLSTSFGFGGQDVAVVWGAAPAGEGDF
jgi:3-oxoacyl-[acyl-carrier-protein] synthase II